MSEVTRVKTPATRKQLADTMFDELQVMFPGAVTPDMAAMLTAQVWLETSNGEKLHNNNPGNLIRSNPSAKSPGFWYRPTWWTDTSSKLHAKAHANPPTAPQAFRAYMTLNDGIVDYLKLLSGPKFAEIIRAARDGDPVSMGDAIKSTGYAPDWGPGQTQNLTGLFKTARSEFFPDDEVIEEVDAGDSSKITMLLAAGAAFVGVKLLFRKR